MSDCEFSAIRKLRDRSVCECKNTRRYLNSEINRQGGPRPIQGEIGTVGDEDAHQLWWWCCSVLLRTDRREDKKRTLLAALGSEESDNGGGAIW